VNLEWFKHKGEEMVSRIHVWVGTALLLAAGVAFAMQEGHSQLKIK